MPSTEALITFTIAAFIMNLSPGPSNFYIMARTLAQGIRGGLAAVAGLAAGGLIHVVAAVMGLSALFAYSPLAYTTLKIVGAGYLIFLGINAWRAANSGTDVAEFHEDSDKRGTMELRQIFKESVLVEVTNPKTALFFIALLPQFVVPEVGPAAPQFLLLGLIVTLSAIPCDLFVTFFASRAATVINGNPSIQSWQDRVSGTILISLGAYVLLSDSRN